MKIESVDLRLGKSNFDIPAGSEVFNVQKDINGLRLFYKEAESSNMTKYMCRTVTAGHEIGNTLDDYTYVGSFTENVFSYHVFVKEYQFESI